MIFVKVTLKWSPICYLRRMWKYTWSVCLCTSWIFRSLLRLCRWMKCWVNWLMTYPMIRDVPKQMLTFFKKFPKFNLEIIKQIYMVILQLRNISIFCGTFSSCVQLSWNKMYVTFNKIIFYVYLYISSTVFTLKMSRKWRLYNRCIKCNKHFPISFDRFHRS